MLRLTRDKTKKLSDGDAQMKILFFDDFKLGILKGDQVVDVSALVADIPHVGPHDLINGLIAQFDVYRPKIEAFVRGATGFQLPL